MKARYQAQIDRLKVVAAAHASGKPMTVEERATSGPIQLTAMSQEEIKSLATVLNEENNSLKAVVRAIFSFVFWFAFWCLKNVSSNPA